MHADTSGYSITSFVAPSRFHGLVPKSTYCRYIPSLMKSKHADKPDAGKETAHWLTNA
jgi:hypothetical protein